MNKPQNYICTKKWARNQVGDIVPRYVIKRYPLDVVQRCFEPYSTKPTPSDQPKPSPSNIARTTKRSTSKKSKPKVDNTED